MLKILYEKKSIKRWRLYIIQINLYELLPGISSKLLCGSHCDKHALLHPLPLQQNHFAPLETELQLCDLLKSKYGQHEVMNQYLLRKSTSKRRI